MLYIKFLQIRAPELLPQTEQIVQLSMEEKKCGFGLVNQIKLNFDNFSNEQQSTLKTLLFRPILQKSIVSPSGFFRIHFDTTGANIPAYDANLSILENVNLIAAAFDSAYSFEVDYLGFNPPPFDNGNGGDALYDIYINETGYYGRTTPEDVINQNLNTNTSYIEIDPSYDHGFYTFGINAARVTAAHELHHAIQVGAYTNKYDIDGFFYELTSTSMEEFVFDNVNDYYSYIKYYMDNTSRKFNRFSGIFDGYDLAIWNIYLVKSYGFEILREQWERMLAQRAMYAISNSLVFKGTSFAKEFNKFGIWTYFTGLRAVPGLYFEEAGNYPLVKPLITISYPQYTYAEVDAEATSNNFIRFGNTTNGDTLYAIVTNGDVSAVINEPQQTFGFTYTLFSDTLSGNRKLADKYSANFNVQNATVWSISEILNDVVVLEDTTRKQTTGEAGYAYPNPFNYKSYFLSEPLIFFPVQTELGEYVDLNIYSSGMQLVYTEVKNIQNLPGDQRGVSWNGLDKENKKLASGVYIYVIKKGDDVVKGKVVIFNE